MKKSWFPFKRKKLVVIKRKADGEIEVLEACRDMVGDRLNSFSQGIQNLEADVEVAAQAIRDAKAGGASAERIRTMENDFRLLVRSLDKHERMRASFQNINDLIAETYDMISIVYSSGQYKRVVDFIPEKALPMLISSGDPADILELKDLLVDVNESIENYLSNTEYAVKVARTSIKNAEQATDVSVGATAERDAEMEELAARYNLGGNSNHTVDTKSEDEQNLQPIKVTKKTTEDSSKNSAR